MAGTEVNPVEVRRTATSVDEHAGVIKSALAVMDGELQGLAGFWQGAAASKFNQCMTEWHQDASKMREALEEISDMLHQTANKYEEQDKA